LLGGAYYFQYIVGLPPCELCLLQRWPHMVAIAAGLAALASFAWPRLALLLVLTAITALIVTAAIGVFHVGVEYHWWTDRRPARATCRAACRPSSSSVTCSAPRWCAATRRPGRCGAFSMAGWNALLCGGLAFVLASGVANW